MSEIAYSVFLIACSAKKAQTQTAVPAVSLYQGQLFKAQLAYARTVLHADDHQIFVMSAKYGLVPLWEPICSYNETLVGMPLVKRKQWAQQVYDQLRSGRFVHHVYLMGGRLYTEPMIAVLQSHGYASTVPHPSGLGYAKQVQWYKEQVKQCGM